MKRELGALVLVAALTGCSGDSDDTAEDRATRSPVSGDPEVVAIVGGVAAAGDASRTVTVLDSDRALDQYLEQFRSPEFAADVRAAVETNPPADGRVLGAAVLEVSCDIPPSATVTEQDGQYVVTPGKVVSPHPECYAAVTSVAVVDLPA